ncbi:hypothetical protein [uncultured Chitinophaga sp.]|jgi:hypothetical protein|uniref:hypothetical protein n=1 Tax=uncultured Chitinophaga sp. TaxID=339340 RepID=UPI0026028E41|nr:hypothetical protein [uncultured Chitinophaga sp.]
MHRSILSLFKVPFRRLFVTVFLLCHIQYATAQNGLPQLLPPSPEAAALFKYLDYGVDYSSGVPQINIPLYEVKCGSLRVPISISYFAGGRKANDVTGPVGLGWSLNAGGMIARTIYGKPDDLSSFPPTWKPEANLTNKDDYDYLASLYYPGGYDSQYDIFSYTAGSYSGRFIAAGSSSEYKLLPLKPVKIFNISGTYPNRILDDKGNEYNYNVDEKGQIVMGYYNQPITAKLLSSIISADKNDTITFTYVTKVQKSYSEGDQYTLIDNDSRIDAIHYSTTYAVNSNYREYAIQRISEIKFRGGKVSFILYPSSDRIKTIEIRNDNNVLLKSIELQSSQLDFPAYTGTEPTYKLDAVLFRDSNLQSIDKYSFEYNASYNFSAKDRDFWGFVNANARRNSILIPKWNNIQVLFGPFGNSLTEFINIPGGQLNGADRNPNSNSQIGVLKKITYPSGGSTAFTFESNQYEDNGIKTGAGLRLAQIQHTDADGHTYYKTYKYGSGESGAGYYSYRRVLMQDLSYEKRYFTQLDNFSDLYEDNFRKRVYTSDLLQEIEEKASALPYYTEVTEYDGTPANNNGKTVYSFDFPYDVMPVITYPSPSFPGVLPAPYQYLDFSGLSVDNNIARRHINRYEPWKTAELQSIDVYRNNGNNTYTRVKSIDKIYKRTETEQVKGTHIYKLLEFGTQDNTTGWNTNTEKHAAQYLLLPVFQFADYTITIGKQELESEIENEFNASGEIGKITTYTYNNRSLPVNINTVSSKGDEFNVQIKYPADFLSDPQIGAISQTMNTANMLLPVEQLQLKGSTLLSGSKTIFKNWRTSANPQIASEFIQEKKGSGSYESRVQFFGYDNRSNITGMSKVADVRRSYIWGYNKLYPIAEAINAAATDIYYTSFEEGDGNSTDGDAKTGRKSHTGGFSKVLSGLTNGGYTLSYWQKSGSNWSLQTSSVNVSSGTYTISLSGQVDEVRFYPAAAEMNTYTYEPLTGMTSHCDAGNHTTFYEYDNYGRLKLVRDQDGKILKQYDYQYQSSFAADWQPTGNTRCERDAWNSYTGNQESEEKDANPYSTTYNTLRWVVSGASSACPRTACTGDGKRPVNNVCQTGTRELVSSEQLETRKWRCTYWVTYSTGPGEIISTFSTIPCTEH